MNQEKHPPHLPLSSSKRTETTSLFLLQMSQSFGAVPEQFLCILWAMDQTHVEGVSAGAHTHASEILNPISC